ncbi:family 1 glycosylhydrolase [Erysipelothrix aquatica]|uniref:glycoside hydrolase family 1 protein n=1 Tax=Erysipelothrix aquatica TaxID=2683714 RepID=UPI00135CE3E4
MMTDKFLWGSATASYQCEGGWDADGKGLGEWDVFSHESPLNINGATGDVSADFYHRYEEDIDMMKASGQNTYRFSISWARIIPNGVGEVNEAGIDFYNRVIDYCLKNDIEPNVTLFHYDLPNVLALKGGWENRDIVDAFEKYAEICFKAFGDRVKLWVTINELRYYSYCSNIVGNYPPNEKQNFQRYFTVIYHEVLASSQAVAIYRKLNFDGQIGIAHDSCNVDVNVDTHEPDKVRLLAENFYNNLILDTSILGKLPGSLILQLREYGIDTSFMKFEDCLVFEKGTIDFLGLNVYNRYYVSDPVVGGKTEVFHNNKGAGSNMKEGIRIENWFETSFDLTTQRNLWGREIYPKCMYDTLFDIKNKYGDIPVYITENGHGCYETPDENGYVVDDERIDMMQSYIDYMLKAKAEGCNVKGYYAWSTMDLYSWVNGYEKRYGFVRVDFENKDLPRYPKKSYYWFKKLIEANPYG